MRESNDALDSLFGPYDFLESQLGAPPPLEPPRDQRMSQSPEDRSGQGSSRGGGRAMGSLDVLDTFPDAPRSGTFIPVGGDKPDVSSEGSGSGVPAPKRGRNGPAAAAESSSELQDKADRCRARNREHARQTRRRKKEFVENLQVSVQTLTRENEMMAARLRDMDERNHERAQRVDTVARILTLRVSETDQGADDPAFWGELVEPDFELRLPHTPYRSFAPYEATASGRTVSGIEAAISDVRSLRVCLASVMRRSAPEGGAADDADAEAKGVEPRSTRSSSGRKPSSGVGEALEGDAPAAPGAKDGEPGGRAECALERSSASWAADGALMATWTLRVSDSRRRVVLQQRGSLKAAFRPAPVGEVDRVVCLEFMFDTVGLWQQLTRAARSPTAEPYVAIPNTLDDAVRDSEDARVVTTAKRPFVIEHVNDAWTKLCGFTAEEAVGKTLAILQGPDTEKGEVADLIRGCEDGHATSALLTNYTKEGDKFQNFLRVFPLTEDDGTKVSHMLGVLQNVNA